MKKRLISLLVVLVLTIFLGVARADSGLTNDLLAKAYSVSAFLQSDEIENYFVRAAYEIILPEDTEGVQELVVKEYSSYREIFLVEVGFVDYRVPPIISSRFVCIGINEDESMDQVGTPFDLFAMTFDFEAFEKVAIKPIG